MNAGTEILSLLDSLDSQRPVGLDYITLTVVSAEGGVELVHSLCLIHANKYEEALPEVWGIVGEIPREDFPPSPK